MSIARTRPRRRARVRTAVACALGVLAALMATVAAAPERAGAAFPGANGRIAFASIRDGNWEIYSMNADGSALTRLTNDPAADLEPAWSPDGSEIAFTRFRNGDYDIYVMKADGSGQTRLTREPAAWDRAPAWSPDGNKIAFTMSNVFGVNADVWVINADGSGLMRLTTDAAADFEPAWSPEGNKIAFTSGRDANSDNNAEIYVMNKDGSGQTRLTNELAFDGNPEWSPDGSKLAFTSTRPSGHPLDLKVYVMNADGSGPTRLTNEQAFELAPAWSPDGSKIALTSNRDGSDLEIYVVNADGSGQTRLTNNPATDESPDWQPLVDTTPPTISVATPPDGASYVLGSTIVADYACADEPGGSGVSSCLATVANGAPIDTASVGTKTFTVDARDAAGNVASLTHSYSVVYAFRGFFHPVDNLPTLNSVKAGAAVPVKFSLGGDVGLSILESGYPKSETIACDSTAPVDGVEETATAGSSDLSYDPATGTYIYVWKTDKAWAGTCRQLVLKLVDESTRQANFRFTG